MPLRQAGYTQEEDKLLCLVYMEISQDPIKGVYQTYEIFWSRVMEAYENGKNASWSERTMKSVKCRIQIIERAAKKLHACIRQCENRRPSGASSDDIVSFFSNYFYIIFDLLILVFVKWFAVQSSQINVKRRPKLQRRLEI